MVSTDVGRKTPRVAVLGAGLSGMTMAIELKKRLNLDTVTIYEREGSVGGTWRDNVYPGCACDVPSHWYSLSTEINPNWSEMFPSQSEIKKYWESIYRKYKLRAITEFNHSFVSGYWDKSRSLWVLKFQNPQTKQPYPEVEAEVVVSAVGGFSTPLDSSSVPIKGLPDFKGETWHSARWNWSYNLENKKIAAIGNGCSAFQFVPELAKIKSSHIYNFSRSPAWTFGRPQFSFSPTTKWIFGHVPGTARLFRWYVFLRCDFRAVIFHNGWGGKYIRAIGEKWASHYIRSTAPKEYHDFLVPKYPLGCKRIIMDPGYLASLGEPNVDLVTDNIDHVDETGIVTKSGKHYDLDVIILGTGFDVTDRGLGIHLKGTDGQLMGDVWKKQGGPQALHGSAVPGFPNAYLLLGPNVATGHASAIFSIEAQINYVVHMIKPMVRNGVKVWSVKKEAQEQDDRDTQGTLKNSVWTSSNCSSYYKLPNGRVHVIWPKSVTSFFWDTILPDWSSWDQIGGDKKIGGGKAPGFFAKLTEATRDVGRTMFGLRLA